MGLSDFPKKIIPPRKRYSAVVPSPSSSSSPPTSAGKKPAPNSDDQSPLGVRQLEDHITSRTQCDDNESLLIRTNLNSNRQNQTLGTIPEACKVFYSDEFNKTATSSSSPSSLKLVGAGIKNMGNTCFMSATLQCFTHISQFVLGVCYCSHNYAPCDVRGFCVLCAFRKHIEAALEPSRSVVIPTLLVENLKYFLPRYVRSQQEDAHEFMLSTLCKLEEYFPNGAENIVDQIFGGAIVSKLQCRNCGYSSESPERIIDLSLVIDNVNTIESALEYYTMAEKIEDCRCESCSKRGFMEKQFLLNKTPSVTALHLKRFKNIEGVQKIDSHVSFSMELDFQPYSSGNGNDNALLKYDLYAVVEHSGPTANSGHYVCYVRSDTNKWHLMDDSKVSSVSEVQVLNAQAYILFYAQQGTPWFSSIVESEEIDPTPRSLDNKYDFGNNEEKGDNDSIEAFYENYVSDLLDGEDCDSKIQDFSP
ncbi:ubiquitinyl hydrolase 1 [Trifolium repens]|nr:ubiquitinyl hydrolase 1 [Trifolium repens]